MAQVRCKEDLNEKERKEFDESVKEAIETFGFDESFAEFFVAISKGYIAGDIEIVEGE